MLSHKQQIIEGFVIDYEINPYEAEINEFNPVMLDLEFTIKNFKKWRHQAIDTTFPYCMKKAEVQHSPYGIVLILGSQKSPLRSMITPLVASIAAGNYTVVNPRMPNIDAKSGLSVRAVTKIIDQLDKDRVI